MDHAAYEWDAEEIHAAHPHLSLAQIHAALSYYHDHKTEMDGQMGRQLENHRRLRSETPGQLTRAAQRRIHGVSECVGLYMNVRVCHVHHFSRAAKTWR